MGNAQAVPRQDIVIPPLEEASRSPTNNDTPLSGVMEPSRNRPVCKFHVRGACSRGDACRFSHETTTMPRQHRSQIQCRFFARGHCEKGNTCKFSHDQLPYQGATVSKVIQYPVNTAAPKLHSRRTDHKIARWSYRSLEERTWGCMGRVW